MAQDNQPDPQQGPSVKMWNKRGDKSFDVEPMAAAKWEAAGWSRKKPPAKDSSGHAGRGGFSGTMPPAQQQKVQPGGGSDFDRGWAEGVNPFHGAPDSTPHIGSGALGKAADIGADMLNLREISDPKQSKGHALGMMGGTITSLAGPELLKVGGRAMKGGLTVAEKSKAAEKAVGLVKELRGSIKDANLSEQVVQRIRGALDAKYEPMHKALEKEIVPINTTAQRLLTRMETNLPKNVQKDVAHLFGRTALDYREAVSTVSKLREAQGQSPLIKAFVDIVDKELDGIASKAGLGTERAQLKTWYRQMNEIARSAHVSIERSAIRAMARSIPNIGKFVSPGEGRVGEQETKAAAKLLKEITGSAKREAIEKMGKATESAAKSYQKVQAMYRAMHSAFNNMGSNASELNRAGQ
jgi:hypothetical protein